MANRLENTYSRLLLSSPFARMAELVDAHDSNSCSARSVGSIPTSGTNNKRAAPQGGFFGPKKNLLQSEVNAKFSGEQRSLLKVFSENGAK